MLKSKRTKKCSLCRVFSEWRVKQGRKVVFAGTAGDCKEYVRKQVGRLIPPNV